MQEQLIGFVNGRPGKKAATATLFEDDVHTGTDRAGGEHIKLAGRVNMTSLTLIVLQGDSWFRASETK